MPMFHFCSDISLLEPSSVLSSTAGQFVRATVDGWARSTLCPMQPILQDSDLPGISDADLVLPILFLNHASPSQYRVLHAPFHQHACFAVNVVCTPTRDTQDNVNTIGDTQDSPALSIYILKKNGLVVRDLLQLCYPNSQVGRAGPLATLPLYQLRRHASAVGGLYAEKEPLWFYFADKLQICACMHPALYFVHEEGTDWRNVKLSLSLRWGREPWLS